MGTAWARHAMCESVLIRTAGKNQKVYRLGQFHEGDVDLWDTQSDREEVYIIISYHNNIV